MLEERNTRISKKNKIREWKDIGTKEMRGEEKRIKIWSEAKVEASTKPLPLLSKCFAFNQRRERLIFLHALSLNRERETK